MSLYLGSEKVENVMAQITTLPAEPSDDLPLADGTANAGVSKKFSRADHVHPAQEIPVQSVNNKTGAVSLTASDVGAVSKTGGTMTGNLKVGSASLETNGYVTGTWLKTTANIASSSAASKIAIINDGWIYTRTAAQIKSDIGLGNVDNVKQYSATNPPPYPVTSVNGATGEVKSTFYVTVTKGEGYTATADKTAEAVYAAYEAGYAVYANLQGATLPLVGAVSNSGAVILGFETILGSGPWDNTAYACVLYNEGVWLTWSGSLARLEDIPAHLPNRFPLEIKIGNTTKSYDGSMKITVKIPEGVPSVTTADNGKFLRVVNGAWASVEIANANGGSF